MTRKIQITLPFDEDLEKHLQQDMPKMVDFRILHQSLDARSANRGKAPTYHYTVEVIFAGEQFNAFHENYVDLGGFAEKPIIIGAGPAGLFCALRLAEYGIPAIIIERGERAERRMLQIARHWRYGEFNPENNVCYGEGGAGLFSDGKLITRIKGPYVNYVMKKFVDFGAPAETAYMSNPHLGSNKIRALINKITEYLKARGHEFRYNTRVDEILFDESHAIGVKLHSQEKIFSRHIVLATGHSAQEMYHFLQEKNIAMAAKNFAVGVRIEHPRREIDAIQYGKFSENGQLGAARYKLSYQSPQTKLGTYSFCMCPGGHVLSSGTDGDGLVVNGMSNFSRKGPWSNAALVVTVEKDLHFSTDDVLGGLHFQRAIEKKASAYSVALATGKEIPAQRVKDFLAAKNGSASLPKSSCPSGLFSLDLAQVLPAFVSENLRLALLQFEKKLPGFSQQNALLLAPETRTSAPVTILRDKLSLQSISKQGLYPCGEGAGHAGGITSAAVDGVKVAMAMIRKEKNYSDS